jgi:hypothetical protein
MLTEMGRELWIGDAAPSSQSYPINPLREQEVG